MNLIAALSFVISGASAFYPSAKVAKTTALKGGLNGWVPDSSAFAYGLPGTTSPIADFDPLGFTKGATLEKVKQLREAETQHGRIAMLAALGFLVTEEPIEFHPLFGAYNMDIGPAIDHLDQVRGVSPIFIELLAVLIGSLEIYRTLYVLESRSEVNLSLTLDLEGWKSLDEFSTSQALTDSYYPGDVGFDPLGLKPKDATEFFEMSTKEINNGRLAMIGVAGMVAQELVNGKEIFVNAGLAADRFDPSSVRPEEPNYAFFILPGLLLQILALANRQKPLDAENTDRRKAGFSLLPSSGSKSSTSDKNTKITEGKELERIAQEKAAKAEVDRLALEERQMKAVAEIKDAEQQRKLKVGKAREAARTKATESPQKVKAQAKIGAASMADDEKKKKLLEASKKVKISSLIKAQPPKGVPVIKSWRKNRNGSIAGKIFGSPNFSDGDDVETSPITTGSIENGSVVTTGSGRRYYLSSDSVYVLNNSKSVTEVTKSANPTLGTLKKSTIAAAPPRGVPSLEKWSKNRDGSITGIISGSPIFNDGDRITTSPIVSGEIKLGAIAQTGSGSRYFLR